MRLGRLGASPVCLLGCLCASAAAAFLYCFQDFNIDMSSFIISDTTNHSSSSATTSIAVERLFTGYEWLDNVTIVVDSQTGLIASIDPTKPSSSSTSTPETRRYHTVMPVLLDIQIYGAYGSLLSACPTVETVGKIAKYCREGGALYFQPTVATNSLEVFHRAIDAVREYQHQAKLAGQRDYCLGLHLEGPWINTAKRGAHLSQYVVNRPSLEEVRALLDYGAGVISMITLAPEVIDDARVLEEIVSRGIVISAGHSNIDYAMAMRCFNGEREYYKSKRESDGAGDGDVHDDQAGKQSMSSIASPLVTTCTHLYNAMSAFGHRTPPGPGLVGAILDHPTVMSSIVADGFHVDFAAIRIAYKLMNSSVGNNNGRLFCITDAVTETDDGPYPHRLVVDDESSSSRYESEGVLSGSALTMWKAMCNLMNYVDISFEEANRMCSLYPAKAISRDQSSERVSKDKVLGSIAVGQRAEFLVWNELPLLKNNTHINVFDDVVIF